MTTEQTPSAEGDYDMGLEALEERMKKEHVKDLFFFVSVSEVNNGPSSSISEFVSNENEIALRIIIAFYFRMQTISIKSCFF